MNIELSIILRDPSILQKIIFKRFKGSKFIIFEKRTANSIFTFACFSDKPTANSQQPSANSHQLSSLNSLLPKPPLIGNQPGDHFIIGSQSFGLFVHLEILVVKIRDVGTHFVFAAGAELELITAVCQHAGMGGGAQLVYEGRVAGKDAFVESTIIEFVVNGVTEIDMGRLPAG